MIVCHCHKVTDRQIRGCVRAGARNLREVSDACSATTGCGGCKRAVAQLMNEEARSDGTSLLPVLSY